MWQDLLDPDTVEDHRVLAFACVLICSRVMWKPLARAVRAACELSRARRAFRFSRLARMTAPTPPMLAATGARLHRRAIRQFYTKREQVGIAGTAVTPVFSAEGLARLSGMPAAHHAGRFFAHGYRYGLECTPPTMKYFFAVASLLLVIPALGHDCVFKDRSAETECGGVVHGTVLAQDGKTLSGVNLILEPLGDYDYVLPRSKTDEHGQYRFSNVSCGAWSVFVEDKEAGYPRSGRFMNWYLYGSTNPEVRITNKNLDAQLDISAPPKPGRPHVNLVDNQTKAKIANSEVLLRVTAKREAQFSCGDSVASCETDDFLVPPNQDVRLQIRSKGFREWKEGAGDGKLIRVPAGKVLTIDAELEPIRN
ncbi:MAG: carboxypeptidase-like regulatory domain-containing protein [Candidatus Acidiferrales bacterium]